MSIDAASAKTHMLSFLIEESASGGKLSSNLRCRNACTLQASLRAVEWWVAVQTHSCDALSELEREDLESEFYSKKRS